MAHRGARAASGTRARHRTMSTERLHFSHANGFPAACYQQLFSHLEADFRISAINTLGHDARYPVSDGWPHLVDELVDYLEREVGAPVIGVGHSLGGYLSYLAAVRRPELFRALILLDSPIMSPVKGRAFGLMKRLGVADRLTPAHLTLERRREWPSAEAAREHFRHKGAFRRFDPACLDDYAFRGTTAVEGGGVRLAFDPVVEHRIYQCIPHDLHRHRRRLAVPAGFIGGRDSEELRRIGTGAMRGRFRIHIVDGGHLFPFERPAPAAAAIRDMARELLR
jgi:pimeloyl-ACP methyl ester carboxylesterase